MNCFVRIFPKRSRESCCTYGNCTDCRSYLRHFHNVFIQNMSNRCLNRWMHSNRESFLQIFHILNIHLCKLCFVLCLQWGPFMNSFSIKLCFHPNWIGSGISMGDGSPSFNPEYGIRSSQLNGSWSQREIVCDDSCVLLFYQYSTHAHINWCNLAKTW